MKLIEKWKGIRKRNKVLILVFVILIFVGIAAFFVLQFSGKKAMDNQGQMPQVNRMENGMVTASGTTATDMVAKQLEIDSLETTLYVEEVYVSSGDTVAAGDKIIKLKADSVEEARKELRRKATEAEVAYKEQKIAYEESVITARKNADITLVEGEYAEQSYNMELENSNQSVEDLRKQTEEALALAEEYYAAVNSDYYYTYYQVGELQETANEPFRLLMELYEEWDIAIAEEAQKKGASGQASGMMEELEYDPEKYSLYQKFDEAVSQMLKELETAKENYADATNKASYSLEAAQADYDLANAKYQEAVAALEQTKVMLKAQCDMAKAEAELAESSYEAEVKQLTEELDKLADEYELAAEDLQTFEDMAGDGYLYADEAGSIMMINARVGNSLDVAMPYLVYSDTNNVTVTVSVEQSYIAQLTVGDAATVMISDLGTYDGVITSINPVSQSNSRSSIYYSVIVTLSGDVSGVTSNLTATVMFRSGMDAMTFDEGTTPQFMNGENFEGEQRDGEEDREEKRPQDMQFEGMPEGMEFEGMPQRPEMP